MIGKSTILAFITGMTIGVVPALSASIGGIEFDNSAQALYYDGTMSGVSDSQSFSGGYYDFGAIPSYTNASAGPINSYAETYLDAGVAPTVSAGGNIASGEGSYGASATLAYHWIITAPDKTAADVFADSGALVYGSGYYSLNAWGTALSGISLWGQAGAPTVLHGTTELTYGKMLLSDYCVGNLTCADYKPFEYSLDYGRISETMFAGTFLLTAATFTNDNLGVLFGFDTSSYAMLDPTVAIDPAFTAGHAGFKVTQFVPTTITVGSSAVPEPATWALMISGLGLMGTALRRRRSALPI